MKTLFVRTGSLLGVIVAVAGTFFVPDAGLAQSTQRSGTLVITGQQEQAPTIRINGKSYVDLESLARIAHGSLRFQGTQTILTLPGAERAGAASAPPAPAPKSPRLSVGYLSAQIEALTQLREWRAGLVNAVQNSLPISESLMNPLRRTADSKLELAIAAATTEEDQQAAVLLRNEFTAMQQMSDQYVASHLAATYIPPDSLENSVQDQKITGCEKALVAMESTKQFQDAAACH
ncbi:MAG TPA: hypothetical protein VGU46_03375 [Acidobacteriaceae bacterium]|nr:hypothetical protein [Acidobacteriaceae bacterium]